MKKLDHAESSKRDLMWKAERAYVFLRQMSISGNPFLLSTLVEKSGYSISTVKAYSTKKWSQILFEDKDGLFICRHMEKVTLEDFKANIRQKQCNLQTTEMPTVVSSPNPPWWRKIRDVFIGLLF